MAETATSRNTSSGTQRIITVRSRNRSFHCQVELNSARKSGAETATLSVRYIVWGITRPRLLRPIRDPSVAMNGGRSSFVMSSAWDMPTSRAAESVTAAAISRTPAPTPLLDITPVGDNWRSTIVNTMLLKAMTDPTDRSIPPLMITIVMPIAKIPSIVVSVVRS